MVHWINLAFLVLIFSACVVFLISRQVKILLGSIGVTTVCIFIISVQFVTFSSGLVRLIATLASLLIIYMSYGDKTEIFDFVPRSAIIFRITAFVIMIVVALLEGNAIMGFLNISLEVIIGGLIAVFCGILQLGITSSPLKIILGIIFFYVGFSSIFCVIENSLLVNGLLSLVILLLGGLGMYFALREVRTSRE